MTCSLFPVPQKPTFLPALCGTGTYEGGMLLTAGIYEGWEQLLCCVNVCWQALGWWVGGTVYEGHDMEFMENL